MNHKELAIKALEQMRGDDLVRAKAFFSRFSLKEMNEQHGESGQTRAAILNGYIEKDCDITAAIEWLKGIAE